MSETEVTELRVEVRHLRDQVDEMRKDIRVIRETLAAARGGWRALAIIGGVLTTLGSAAAWAYQQIR
jgi:hypothetical protein